MAVALAAGTSTAGSGEAVHALLFQGQKVSFAALDPMTLAQRGRLVPLGHAQGSVSTGRLGSRIAVASVGAGVVIVDTRRMRVQWRVSPRGVNVRAVSWVSPSRLLVVEHGGVLLLDPVRKRVVGRSGYNGLVVASAPWSRGLVLLAHRDEIAPARLVVVGPGSRTRSIERQAPERGSAPRK